MKLAFLVVAVLGRTFPAVTLTAHRPGLSPDNGFAVLGNHYFHALSAGKLVGQNLTA